MYNTPEKSLWCGFRKLGEMVKEAHETDTRATTGKVNFQLRTMASKTSEDENYTLCIQTTNQENQKSKQPNYKFCVQTTDQGKQNSKQPIINSKE